MKRNMINPLCVKPGSDNDLYIHSNTVLSGGPGPLGQSSPPAETVAAAPPEGPSSEYSKFQEFSP